MRVLQGNPPWACLRIRHELLRPVSAIGFQQLGSPVGNLPYHPDGPPWLAGSGLRRWYTYLVYPQQSSCLSSFFYSLRLILSGARPALPMRVAPEAIRGCVQPFIDSNISFA
jgi:hypothetical protein